MLKPRDFNQPYSEKLEYRMRNCGIMDRKWVRLKYKHVTRNLLRRLKKEGKLNERQYENVIKLRPLKNPGGDMNVDYFRESIFRGPEWGRPRRVRRLFRADYMYDMDTHHYKKCLQFNLLEWISHAQQIYETLKELPEQEREKPVSEILAIAEKVKGEDFYNFRSSRPKIKYKDSYGEIVKNMFSSLIMRHEFPKFFCMTVYELLNILFENREIKTSVSDFLCENWTPDMTRLLNKNNQFFSTDEYTLLNANYILEKQPHKRPTKIKVATYIPGETRREKQLTIYKEIIGNPLLYDNEINKLMSEISLKELTDFRVSPNWRDFYLEKVSKGVPGALDAVSDSLYPKIPVGKYEMILGN